MDDTYKGPETLLRLIQGGKNPPKAKVIAGASGKAASGLTVKQEAFAQSLAEGATNSEAYRAAYNADGMAAAVVHTEACKLAQHPKVAMRVEDLLREKQAKHRLSAVKAEDRIWRQVWGVLEADATPAAVKVSAAALAAKLAGMVTDKVQIEAGSVADIERELTERLKRYASD
jgi:phage terminase small subunit